MLTLAREGMRLVETSQSGEECWRSEGRLEHFPRQKGEKHHYLKKNIQNCPETMKNVGQLEIWDARNNPFLEASEGC